MNALHTARPDGTAKLVNDPPRTPPRVIPADPADQGLDVPVQPVLAATRASRTISQTRKAFSLEAFPPRMQRLPRRPMPRGDLTDRDPASTSRTA